MRDIQEWWLRLVPELPARAKAYPAALLQAEVGLWLARYLGIAPAELAYALSMSSWVATDWSSEQRRALAVARCYLPTGTGAWRRLFDAYREFDPGDCLYDLDENLAAANIAAHAGGLVAAREDVYAKFLNTAPPYEMAPVRWATGGQRIRYTVHDATRRIVYEAKLPDNWGQLPADQTLPAEIALTDRTDRPLLVVRRTALAEVADFLDRLEAASANSWPRLKPQHWHRRLESMQWLGFAGNSLAPQEMLIIAGTVHLPGVLAVGKSTLLTLTALWAALNGLHLTLVVGDVSGVLQLADELDGWLLHPLVTAGVLALPCDITVGGGHSPAFSPKHPPAVPILGRTGRKEHITQLTVDTEKRAREHNRVREPHIGWRWLRTDCPLSAYGQAVEGDTAAPVPAGQAPCDHLEDVEKTASDHTKRDKADSDVQTRRVTCLCPLLATCPVLQADRDLTTAAIWITTPQALAQSRAPRLLTSQHMSVYELVYRWSDLVLVDECDAAQGAMDDAFMPSDTLAQPGPGTGLFSNLVAEVNTRGALSTSDTSTRHWINAVYTGKAVVEIVYDLLTHPTKGERIRAMVGTRVFFNTELFALVLWSLLDVPEPQQASDAQKKAHARCFEALRAFMHSPDGTLEMRSNSLLQPLVGAGQILISQAHTDDVRQILTDWVESARLWAAGILAEERQRDAASGPQVPTRVGATSNTGATNAKTDKAANQYWQSLAAQVEFAVAVTLMDRRLTTIVAGWNAAPPGVTIRQNRLRRNGQDLEMVLPAPPTGQIFGFQYTGDWRHPEREGALKYIQFSAVGRWLLLHGSDLYMDLDGRAGPHMLLVSGTSWAPPSSQHVAVPPQGALVPVNELDNTQTWDWKYHPLHRVSGATGDERLALARLAGAALARSDGLIRHILDDLAAKATSAPDHWADRSRILVLTGSYDETDQVLEGLLSGAADTPALRDQCFGLERPDGVRLLPGGEQANHRLAKGALRDTAVVDRISVLVAPMGSLGRAVNILNHDRKAAFGAVLFVVRALRPPHEPQIHACRLIYWAQQLPRPVIPPENFGRAAQALRHAAHGEWFRLLTSDKPWRQMEADDRLELASTLFTQTWQSAGRGIRGEVPVEVYFVDAAFGVKENDVLHLMATSYDAFFKKTYVRQSDQPLVKALFQAAGMDPGETLGRLRDNPRDQALKQCLYRAPLAALEKMLDACRPPRTTSDIPGDDQEDDIE